MTVSLALGGDGLGTVWGEQTAERMLREAGFGAGRGATLLEEDPFNAYYIATLQHKSSRWAMTRRARADLAWISEWGTTGNEV